ncbi:unnamed protein product [Linum trigynum]|uniref:Uncharacterized protein n=1 Tax=Linum trigynum TaxID=586398 RepID=A0AAV2E637_9ROSI
MRGENRFVQVSPKIIGRMESHTKINCCCSNPCEPPPATDDPRPSLLRFNKGSDFPEARVAASTSNRWRRHQILETPSACYVRVGCVKEERKERWCRQATGSSEGRRLRHFLVVGEKIVGIRGDSGEDCSRKSWRGIRGD